MSQLATQMRSLFVLIEARCAQSLERGISWWPVPFHMSTTCLILEISLDASFRLMSMLDSADLPDTTSSMCAELTSTVQQLKRKLNKKAKLLDRFVMSTSLFTNKSMIGLTAISTHSAGLQRLFTLRLHRASSTISRLEDKLSKKKLISFSAWSVLVSWLIAMCAESVHYAITTMQKVINAMVVVN